MRKRLMGKFIIICLVMFLIFAFAGCSLFGKADYESDGKPIAEEFRGGWECEETTLENPDGYTGYLHLEVSDDGTYSMYDIGAGNPGIEGWIEVISENELILHIKKTADTDIPDDWDGISFDQEMKYRFTEDGKLQIVYDDGQQTSTLVFYRWS